MHKTLLYASWVLTASLFAASCDDTNRGTGAGGEGAATGGGGAGSTSTGPGPSGCGEAFCAALGAACGKAIDGCGEPVSCGLCRYSAEDVASAEFPSLHISATETLVSYVEGGNIMLARREGGAWMAETAAITDGIIGTAPELAVGPDGVRWITFSSSSHVSVAWAPPNGPWTTEEITGDLHIGLDPDIAIAPDGSPVIVFGGFFNGVPGAFIARRVEGAFQVTNVAATSATGAPRNVAFALRGHEAHVVFIEQNESYLGYAFPDGGGYKVEVIDPSVSFPDDGALAMSFDTEGRPHVLYGNGGSTMAHAVRDGAWTTTTISSSDAARDNALAIDPKGVIHAAFYDDYGLVAADRAGDVFLQQQISGCTDDGSVDMAIDPAGQVVLVHACPSGVKLLTRTGTYPAEFGQACDAVAQGLCDKACPLRCFANRWADVCDPTRDPALVQACEAALGELTCTSDADSWGAQVPPACDPLF
jgi:hypothetical protein